MKIINLINGILNSSNIVYNGQILDNVFKYVLDEVVIGKWINGKKLYRKVINFGALPDSSTKAVAHGISNLESIIDIKGICANDTSFLALPYANPIHLYLSIAVYANKNNVYVEVGSDRSAYKNCYIILEYTKETD